MADTTLPGLLGTGDHASRPAASAVGSGALYACSDHQLIYQSDGSSWSTWWTGATGSMTNPMTTAGDIIYSSDGSGTPARLAAGTDGHVLTLASGIPAWAAPSGGGGATRPSAYGNAIMALEPIAYYPMQEASGILMQDVSGSGLHGSYAAAGVTYQAAGPTTGETYGVTLNGSSGYAYVPVHPFRGYHAWSIAAWFKTSATGRSEIAGMRDSALSLTVGPTAAGGAAGKVAYWCDGSGTDYGIYSNSTYNDGNWHLAVGTWMSVWGATAAHADMALYIDGSAAATSNNSTGSFAAPRYTTAQPGRAAIGVTNALGSYFNGSLAHVAFFPRKLSSSEVTTLWDARDD